LLFVSNDLAFLLAAAKTVVQRFALAVKQAHLLPGDRYIVQKLILAGNTVLTEQLGLRGNNRQMPQVFTQ